MSSLNLGNLIVDNSILGVNMFGSGSNTGGNTSVYAISVAQLSGWTYDNGVSGVGATLTAAFPGGFTIDGVVPPVGSLILYKDDVTGSGAYNGIYKVAVNQSDLAGKLIRSIDYDTPSEINETGLIVASQGLTLAGKAYYLTTYVTTVGTSPLTYAVFTVGVSSITGTANQVIASAST